MEPVLGPHARTDRTRNTRVAVPRLPAPEEGVSGEGQRLTPDAPHNSGRPPPPGTAPHHPRGTQPPQGMQAKETVLGPHTHTPAPTARGWRTAPSQVAGNQDRTAPPRSTPDGARDRGRTRGGARTTWNGPTSAKCRYRARCARHTTQGGGSRRRGSASAHTRKGHVGTTRKATGPSSRNAETAWNGVPASEGKGHPDGTARHTQSSTRKKKPQTPNPHNGESHPHRGRPSATPTASNASPQGRTRMPWGPCWVSTLAPTATETHGSRNPGCPPQRTGDRGRDSA